MLKTDGRGRWSVESVERRENSAVVERQRRSIVVDDVAVKLVVCLRLHVFVIQQLTKRVQLTFHTENTPFNAYNKRVNYAVTRDCTRSLY